ncbi:uncharacterized protein A4U43_C01F25360 [Asparagus officinalis]|uniref:Uncharacterized protein n=1 Tax=Asparagus officinalis TaxID=4686 RepID=A0A5P1FS08_ASPOF|nr:uncharacterized protein LOC109843556 [Asparagus officinalis]ONK81105.1 uncharacterized protein A4U43_C01F25360 [Asparagus officinalis]
MQPLLSQRLPKILILILICFVIYQDCLMGMVFHEGHQPKCSSVTNPRSSSSKKNKAKKIPQRGLGVAQLEKLRIEEQQKNNCSGSSSSLPLNPLHPIVSSQKKPCIPYFASEPSPSLFRSAAVSSLNPTVDFFKQSASNCEEDLDNFNVSEKIGILGLNQHQNPMANNKIGFIPVSSGVNLQIEPPSNQNYSNNAFQREEVQVAGTNLPWPFYPETVNEIALRYKIPQYNNPFLNPEELSNYGLPPLRFEHKRRDYGKSPLTIFENRFTGYSKEGAPSYNSYQVDRKKSEVHMKKRLRDIDASLDSGFLSLGNSSTQSSSKLKHSIMQSQGNLENPAKRTENSSEQTFYSFLPMAPSSHETDANEESNIDLNLKLY